MRSRAHVRSSRCKRGDAERSRFSGGLVWTEGSIEIIRSLIYTMEKFRAPPGAATRNAITPPRLAANRLLRPGAIEQVEVAAHSERKPCARIVVIDASDGRGVPLKTAGNDLHPQS